MDVDTHKALECVTSLADTYALSAIRVLCKEAKQLADAQAPLREKLKEMRSLPGWKRRVALDNLLRTTQNKTRWRSLADVKKDKFATLIVARHIKLKPVSAPSRTLVVDCLHALDASLDELKAWTFHGGGFQNYRPLQILLIKLNGYRFESIFRHALRGQGLDTFDKLLKRHS